jgi:DNA-binding protein
MPFTGNSIDIKKTLPCYYLSKEFRKIYLGASYLLLKKRETTRMIEDNVVFIGNKPVMNYVLAIVTQFNNGSAQVTVKARGKAISRAVDAVEVSRNRFLHEIKIKDIKIGTEKIATDRGDSNVSTIEIVLDK